MNLNSLFFYLLGMLLLIACSGFFSGSETALFSVNRIQLKRLDSGTASEKIVSRLLRNPQRLLSTIVVGNMLVNVLFASMIATLTRQYFGEKALAAAIAVSTVLLLLFGEVAPKTVAVYHALPFSRLVAMPLHLLAFVFTPLRMMLQGVTNTLLKMLRQKTMTEWDTVSKEEIAGMISLGEAAGATTDKESAMLENILEFGEVAADDIMIPRNEVEGIDDNSTVREAFAMACQCMHSRMPIYHDNMDDIWGIFSVVDMPRFLADGIADQPLSNFRRQIESASDSKKPDLPVYPALVFPEMARLDDLLTRMKELRVAMVVLVDEYGGTAGILTLDDVLEEIVGRLTPAREGSEEELVVTENYIMANGRIHIRDFNRRFNLKIPQEEADTLGGYVMELLERLPRTGDVVEKDGLRFRVMRMIGRRVGALRIERVEQKGEDDFPP